MVNGIQFQVESYKQKEKYKWVSRYINNISVIEKLEKSFAELRFPAAFY